MTVAPPTVALPASPLQRAAPIFFVLLWSTGFIGAKLGLPYAGPMTFLAVRFVLVAVLTAPLALLSGARWPRSPVLLIHIAVVGLLMQFTYLGGVFIGIAHGVPAGISALIVGLQPILTAALAGVVLGETIRPRQWLGLALGLVGVALVVVNPALFDRDRLGAAGITIIAMISITVGTLYQKRFCTGVDLRSTIVIQNAVAGLAMVPAALLFEPTTIDWSPRFIFAIVWLGIVLSVGATMLLFYLIRHGAASRVSSLFYLTPAVTAVMAFLLFGEMLSPLALVGMALAAGGVWAVNSGRARLMLWSEHASAPAALPVPDGALWIFAYGSLMWDPGFPHEAILPAEIDGYGRAFCVRSRGHRGTPDQPGLVVGLTPGGRCRGLLIQAQERHKASILDYLWRREMDLADGYMPRRVIARLDDGRRIEALTFVADLAHEAYAGILSVEETARRIAAAHGQRGSNRDYLERTLAQLDRLGIRDPGLVGLGRAVAALGQRDFAVD